MNRFLGIVLVAFLMQAPTDCFAGASGTLAGISNTYDTKGDKTLTAAENSARAEEINRHTDAVEASSLSAANLSKNPPDYTEVDKAIRENPDIRGYKFTKAAMLRSQGRLSEAEALEAEIYAMYVTGWPPGSERYTNSSFHKGMALTLETAAKNAPPGPNKVRLEAEMCAHVRAVWRIGHDFGLHGSSVDPFDGRC